MQWVSFDMGVPRSLQTVRLQLWGNEANPADCEIQVPALLFYDCPCSHAPLTRSRTHARALLQPKPAEFAARKSHVLKM